MRSSKSRSRSKPNRNRSVGNVVNRVFDSSGPEGKVRGTPQQIIEKYTQLARDAQLSGDRVAMENFQQHSEHYTRMLAEAQREQDARRDQHEAQQRDRQPQQNEQREDRSDRHDRDNGGHSQHQPQPQQQSQPQHQHQPQAQPYTSMGDQPQPDVRPEPQARPKQPQARPDVVIDSGLSDILDLGAESDSGLVETPESKPTKPRARRPRKPSASKPANGGDDSGSAAAAE